MWFESNRWFNSKEFTTNRVSLGTTSTIERNRNWFLKLTRVYPKNQNSRLNLFNNSSSWIAASMLADQCVTFVKNAQLLGYLLAHVIVHEIVSRLNPIISSWKILIFINKMTTMIPFIEFWAGILRLCNRFELKSRTSIWMGS